MGLKKPFINPIELRPVQSDTIFYKQVGVGSSTTAVPKLVKSYQWIGKPGKTNLEIFHEVSTYETIGYTEIRQMRNGVRVNYYQFTCNTSLTVGRATAISIETNDIFEIYLWSNREGATQIARDFSFKLSLQVQGTQELYDSLIKKIL